MCLSCLICKKGIVIFPTFLGSKEFLHIHATAWMDLEDITLSARSQSRKNKYCMIPLTGGIWSSPVRVNGKQSSDYQGLGETGMGFQSGKIRKFWRWKVVIVTRRYECAKCY